jgi:ubiquinone/menaquinone biosynthesis C-methylase UbiE
MNENEQAAKLRKHYDRLSLFYDIVDWPYEHGRYRRIRPLLCSDVEGNVLDAGVGTGRNLPYYTAASRVTGIDLSGGQLRRARRRASEAHCPVDLKRMDVTRMGFEDASFDACVATFLFCVMPDELQLPALREILRVVRPGGTVRLLEYVYSSRRSRRWLMKAMAPCVEGVFRARFDRPTRQAVVDSGAELVCERFVYADTILLLQVRSSG